MIRKIRVTQPSCVASAKNILITKANSEILFVSGMGFNLISLSPFDFYSYSCFLGALAIEIIFKPLVKKDCNLTAMKSLFKSTIQ